MGNDAVQIWREFCQNLETAGQGVLASDLAGGTLDQAEGVRYLTRLLRIGLEMHLEHADPAFPRFYQASHDNAKIGADNPDNFYQNATISGEHRYRIFGNRGSVPILSFGTKANRYAVDGTMASTGELDIRDVVCDGRGNFEIIANQEREGENWLPLAADSSMAIVRQTFFDRAKETPAQVQIERLDGEPVPAPFSVDALAEGLARVPAFVGGTSKLFIDWADLFRRENRNALNTSDQSMFFAAGGDPMIHYLHGWWELQRGQALEITSAIPDCEGWNIQINNVWMESLDYRYHQIHTNNGLAALDDDGSVTVTVSPRRQGKNWLDTAGHSRGTMLWRWTGANEHPVPKVQVIDAAR